MFLGCLLVQVLFLPLLAAEAAREFPEFAYLQYPILAAAILTVGCIEVVIVATGALLAKTNRGEIFRADALRWVGVMIATAFVATGICAAVFGYLAYGAAAMSPPVELALVAAIVASACCSSCCARCSRRRSS
ncbi:hypothetical protein BSZ39_11245 [Bowdeniella nasicola]|uniref:Uncharacterized protein n=1 Tax=Bowdeniella nasicola TaxID=208480 RepID=A0A1Q5Q080_9ACTO|nr:DUF2975 domain-containing protein [Bowdeniella nasicola]OKL53112.1 hypothetical protein BSZ39_11245 [Bowdeniella nasicola]